MTLLSYIYITVHLSQVLDYTRNDMLIDHDLWLSERKPDYYYFEAQTKKIKHGYL